MNREEPQILRDDLGPRQNIETAVQAIQNHPPDVSLRPDRVRSGIP
jgi:hypothetical protein